MLTAPSIGVRPINSPLVVVVLAEDPESEPLACIVPETVDALSLLPAMPLLACMVADAEVPVTDDPSSDPLAVIDPIKVFVVDAVAMMGKVLQLKG